MANRFLSNIKINDAYTFPATDGTTGQVITTDGSGNLSFSDVPVLDGARSNFVYYDVKNSSGSTINKGTAVMVAGTDGNSGHILIAPMVADGSVEPKYFMGVLETTLLNGEIGKVVHFGEISQLNTTAFADGDILWCDPANPGGFTVTEPLGPNLKIAAAIVISSATNGKIKVRVQGNEGLHELHDVKLVSEANGDLLQWNGTTGVWENKSLATIADSRYVNVSGDNMSGDINWGATNQGLTWGMNTDGAYIKFFNTGDGDTDSRLEYGTSDNGNEYHRFMISGTERMRITATGITATGYNKSNWDTAYGWGDHSDNLYLPIGGKAADSELLDGIDSTGFVKQLANTTDANFTTPSSRRLNPSVTGPNANDYFALSTFGNNDNVTGQLAVHFTNGQLYSRAFNTDWSSWKRYWSDSDFTTTNVSNWNAGYNYSTIGHLPLSGGTLTGALSINASDGVKATFDVSDGDTWLRGWGIESNRGSVYLRPSNNNTQTLFIGYSEGSQNWNAVSVDASSFDFNGNAIIHAGNIAGQSVNYATSAGNANTLDNIDSSAFVQKYNAYGGGDHNMHVWNNVHATYSDNSNTSAWIVVQTSVPQESYSMGGFELVFEEDYQNASEGGTLKIYGYWDPEVNGGFIGFKYTTDNPLLNPNIYVARNTTSGNTAFLIQGGNTAYAQIIARNLWLGYSASGANAAWGDGWSISEQADQSGFTNIDQLTNASRSYFQPASTAITTSNISTQSVAYAANAGLLDSIDPGSFLRSDVNDTASGKVFFTHHTTSDPLAAVEINGGTTHTGLYINPSASSQAHIRFGTNGTLKWQFRVPFQTDANADLKIYSWVSADDMYNFKHTGELNFAKSSGTIISTGGGSDAFGYNSSYGHYIQGTGSRYIYGDGIYYDGAVARTLIHSGNIASQSVASAGNADTLDSLDSSQFVRSDVNFNKYGWLAVYSTIGADDNVRSGLAHYDDSPMAAGVGGQIVLGYKYTAAGGYTEGAIIKMYKENGTDLEYGSGLKFQVRNHTQNLNTKMILDPSGRLGIGTLSPNAALEVNGNIYTTSNTNFLLFGTNPAANPYIQGDSDNSMYIGIGNSARMTVKPNGKVGVGTTNPSNTKVHIVGDGSFVGNYGYNTLTLEDSSGYAGLNFRQGNNNWLIRNNGDDQGLDFVFSSDASGQGTGTYTQLIKIKKTGEVGIGTTLPGRKLDVVGDWKLGNISGGYFGDYHYGTELNIAGLTTGGWARANKITTSDSDGTVFFGVLGDNTTLARAYWTIGNPATVDTTGYASTNGIILLKNGSVGIGKTNPSYKLDVDGAVKAGTYFVSDYYRDSRLEALIYYAGSNQIRVGSGVSTDYLLLYSGGQPRMTVLSTGYIGINNTNPSNLLTIGADSHYSPGDTNRVLNWYTFGSELWNNEISLSIGNNNAGTTQPTKVGLALFNNSTTNNTYSPAITFGGLSTSGSYMNGSAAIAAQLPANADNNFRGGNLIFYTAGLGGDKGLKENVRIQHNGFLGVGTSGPSEKMHVNGSVYIEGTGNSLYFDTDASGKSIKQYVANLYEFHILNARGNSSRFILGNGSISLGTSSTPFFYINTTNGHVGINSTSPSARLTVAGTIRSTEQVDVSPSGGAFRFYDGTTFYGGLGIRGWSGVGATADMTMYLLSSQNNKFHVSRDATAFATFDSANSSFKVESTIGAGDNVRYGIGHYDDTPVAAGVGGQIVLGYKYTSAGDRTEGAIIKMYKENGTSGHYGSGLKFQVRNTGDNLSTKLTLNPSGTLTAVGDVIAYSDARVKENIETIDNALDKVMSMRGVSYNRIDGGDKTKKVGVIAQEIQKVLPEVVQEQEDGILGVSYGNIVGVLIEAIKEQNQVIEDLKQRIAKLEA